MGPYSTNTYLQPEARDTSCSGLFARSCNPCAYVILKRSFNGITAPLTSCCPSLPAACIKMRYHFVSISAHCNMSVSHQTLHLCACSTGMRHEEVYLSPASRN